MKQLHLLFFLLPTYLYAQDNTIKYSNFFDDLTKVELDIVVDKGTEPAFSGKYVDFYEQGVYVCKACNSPLFESESKFKSNCGWPSFDDEINNSLIRIQDNSYGIKRVEICCANCKGHLGHVFKGEKLTEKDMRHCVNSISIRFISKK